MTPEAKPRPLWNPYVAGAALGVLLFASFLLTSHGLGASGGLARLLTAGLDILVPQTVDRTAFFSNFGGGGRAPLSHWLVWEILGATAGGAISGLLARRLGSEVCRGPAISSRLRLLLALLGGALVGWGTQLSRGCTSGQALSGGAVLAVGSWAFMFAVFGGAYLVAWPLRRLWR